MFFRDTRKNRELKSDIPAHHPSKYVRTRSRSGDGRIHDESEGKRLNQVEHPASMQRMKEIVYQTTLLDSISGLDAEYQMYQGYTKDNSEQMRRNLQRWIISINRMGHHITPKSATQGVLCVFSSSVLTSPAVSGLAGRRDSRLLTSTPHPAP
jgi:hypothetical protein